jgi:hypothetical protein
VRPGRPGADFTNQFGLYITCEQNLTRVKIYI